MFLIIFKIPKLWCNLTNQSGLSKNIDLSCIFLLMLTSVYSVVEFSIIKPILYILLVLSFHGGVNPENDYMLILRGTSVNRCGLTASEKGHWAPDFLMFLLLADISKCWSQRSAHSPLSASAAALRWSSSHSWPFWCSVLPAPVRVPADFWKMLFNHLCWVWWKWCACMCRGHERHERVLHPGWDSRFIRCHSHSFILQTESKANLIIRKT